MYVKLFTHVVVVHYIVKDHCFTDLLSPLYHISQHKERRINFPRKHAYLILNTTGHST